jgi:hypothetical protein
MADFMMVHKFETHEEMFLNRDFVVSAHRVTAIPAEYTSILLHDGTNLNITEELGPLAVGRTRLNP